MTTARRPIDQAHRDAVTGIHRIVANGTNGYAVGLGISALAVNTADTTVGIGYEAGKANTSGSHNVSVGYGAGWLTSTGGYNTFIGALAGRVNTTGQFNMFLGYYSGYNNSTHSYNTFIGAQSGRYSTANYNTFIGGLSAFGITTGASNTAIGYQAARYLADGSTANQTSANGTYLGYEVRASAAGAANETAIGNGAIGGGSNTVRLGNAAVTHWLPGATDTTYLGNTTHGFKALYLHDGTDEWAVTINASGTLVTTKV